MNISRRTFLGVALPSIAAIKCYAAEPKTAKYIFYFIGDGMSIPQRMATEEYSKRTSNKGLEMNSLPNHAVTYTWAANSFITDSAAGGTALACGVKTNNGYIGVDPSKKPVESVAVKAKKAGKKVGIVTSVTINHATPAVFYAHDESRNNYYRIATQMTESGFDYFGGGGIAHPDKKDDKEYRGDAYELAKKAGYAVYKDVKKISDVKKSSGKVMAFGAEQELPYAIDNDGQTPTLAEFTKLGIDLMADSPNGFFMMIEGGKIDWACHANDAATVIKETIDMDAAVKVALDFAKRHPDETLIVITADHETGGMTLGCDATKYNTYIELLSVQKCSWDAFDKKLKKALKNSSDDEFKIAAALIEENFGLKFEGDPKSDRLALTEDEISAVKNTLSARKSEKKVSLGKLAAKMLDTRASIGWTSGAHTALPVDTTAVGVNAEAFKGALDNTDIPKMLSSFLEK